MKVRIIGGHGGVSPGYKATSYLIDDVLLIDAGSVASGLPISEQKKIDTILISHAHLDHISDLAFLADNCFGLKDSPFEIYTNAPVAHAIRTHLLNDIIWPDFTKLPSSKKPTLRLNELTPEVPIVIGDYSIVSVPVNHQGGATGFLIEKKNKTLLFTQDTGPTERIWEYAHERKNLVGIFSEISFPNHMMKVAIDSQHHTPSTMADEILKMPGEVPIYVGHIKPNFESQLIQEIRELGNPRLHILGGDVSLYKF